MLSEYLLVGTVLRPQGIKGQVKIKPETNDPERFLDLGTVYLQSKDAYLPATLEDVSVRGGLVYACLNKADTRQAAEAQRGWALHIRRDDAAPLEPDTHYISDLIGCLVVDLQGAEIGRIKEVLQPGANDVYVIATSTGRILLPALKRVVPEVDVHRRLVTVDTSLFSEVAVIED
ncbi:MAG: ribosome maturation factor RimM [Christensenellales bacterium]